MDYVKLGRTGLDVSRLCLGCMSFGDKENWIHKWLLDEAESRQIIKKALEMGINFFDTANSYSGGVSEEILGRAIRDYATRDEVVLATKVFFPMQKGPNRGGLSRKSIINELDHSLKRLGTDYVDLYIIHRWDDQTPIEETMETLHDVVKAGKARYIGASSMQAWQFLKANHVAESNGWTKFVSMQNHYNLLYREEEREMMPMCESEGIGVTPYSPLASGRLTRAVGETTYRSQTDQVQKAKYGTMEDSDNEIITRVASIAERRGVLRMQVALAWLLQKQPVTAPIIGATKLRHLEDAKGALSIKLTDEEMSFLEESYLPHPVSGFALK
ncbi:oxidoreductase [Bacillus sp. FJAT-27916]|uniref:aldo/keto reductase n=1 Tax=Bacillaceae TaxID=186817 RepID=UPI000670A42F|nr:aldo/keto reductase [Bacillus sp. FJAT-27916]KMY45193.1 oxidoreductase [Bacillus sp. FJAT-27916]